MANVTEFPSITPTVESSNEPSSAMRPPVCPPTGSNVVGGGSHSGGSHSGGSSSSSPSTSKGSLRPKKKSKKSSYYGKMSKVSGSKGAKKNGAKRGKQMGKISDKGGKGGGKAGGLETPSDPISEVPMAWPSGEPIVETPSDPTTMDDGPVPPGKAEKGMPKGRSRGLFATGKTPSPSALPTTECPESL
jgi:hypothetical protein